MAVELEERMVSQIVRFERLGKLLGWLVACAFLFGGWVATLEIRQRATDREISKIQPIEEWMIAANENRWTIQDHFQFVKGHDAFDRETIAALNKRNELQELRLQRLEDEQGQIIRTIEDRLSVTPSDVLAELKKLTGER